MSSCHFPLIQSGVTLPLLLCSKGSDMKKLVLALAAFGLLADRRRLAVASPCRNKAGKFVKCPPKPKLCRDSKGHFTKCKK